jgi:hypothetical protein
MPPVMGAVAFIMAETLNIPYIEVIRAAIISVFRDRLMDGASRSLPSGPSWC